MPTNRTLGELLREARESAGLTQARLAERVGLAPSHLVRLESGEKVNPRFETVAHLASELGLSLDDLAAALGFRTSPRVSPPSSQAAVGVIQAMNRFLLVATEAQTVTAKAIAVIAEDAGLGRAAKPGKRAKVGKRPRS